MSQNPTKHEGTQEKFSQENAKKKQKTLPRSDDEVLDVLKSLRDKEVEYDVGTIAPLLVENETIERLATRTKPEAQEKIEPEAGDVRVYTVIYGKNKPYKKHKTFEFDGTLTVKGLSATIKDSNGVFVSQCSEYRNNELTRIEDGYQLVVGDQLCEITM